MKGKISLLLLVACAREPLPCVSSVKPGELVITEVCSRKGCGFDFVEVCNVSSERLGLAGLGLVVARPDGSGKRTLWVRDYGLVSDPGSFFVLGLGLPTSQAGAQDAAISKLVFPLAYDASQDWTLQTGFYPAGVLELWACGELIDRVVYRELPENGSLALNGVLWPPTAEGNDSVESWCKDTEIGQYGFPGTPSERNRPCSE